MSALQVLWFILIAVLWSGFFFLEGFDFGVGMSYFGLGRNDSERELLYRTIGPHWDANEVWLLTAGGATFAAFPYWYASLFSGFYIMLFIVLLALIYRGVAFEFKEHMPNAMKARSWEKVTAISSFVAPFGLGMIFTAMVSGMPIDANGDILGGFFNYVNLFSIVGGVAVALMTYIHGLTFIRIRVADADLRKRATSQLNVLYPLLLAGEVVFAVLLYFFTDFIQTKLVLTILILAVIVVTTVCSWLLVIKNKEVVPFILSGFTMIELVVLLFVGLFPRVMVANDPANSLLIENSSSSPHTLMIMTWVVILALPVTLGYQIWSFYIFRKRLEKTEV